MITTRRRRSPAVVALLALALLLFAGCGSDDGDDESTGAGDGTESTTSEATTASTEAETTTTGGTSSEATEPEEPTETTDPTGGQLAPGDPCSLEEGDPDCIDPDGDGEGVYLIDGGECAATAPDIIACEDVDGDGVAGAPDEYEDLPTCSEEVPPPCNNPPGSHNDE